MAEVAVEYAHTTFKDMGLTTRPDADVVAALTADLTVAKIPPRRTHLPTKYLALVERRIGGNLLAYLLNSRAPACVGDNNNYRTTALEGDLNLPLRAKEQRKKRLKYEPDSELGVFEEYDALHRRMKLTKDPYTEYAATSVDRWMGAIRDHSAYSLMAQTLDNLAPFFHPQKVERYLAEVHLTELLTDAYGYSKERQAELRAQVLGLLTAKEIRLRAHHKYSQQTVVDPATQTLDLGSRLYGSWPNNKVDTSGEVTFSGKEPFNALERHMTVVPSLFEGDLVWDNVDFGFSCPGPVTSVRGLYPLLGWQFDPKTKRRSFLPVKKALGLVNQHQLFADRGHDPEEFDPILGRIVGFDMTSGAKESLRNFIRLGEGKRTNFLAGASILLFAYIYRTRILDDRNRLCPELEGLFHR